MALLLVVATAAGCAPAEQRVTIRIHYSAFDPAAISVARGVPVTFVLVNEDPMDHEWLIGDEAFHEAHRTGTHATHDTVPREVTVPALETVETTTTFDQSGELAYICHLPGHEAFGMVGVLTVGG
ncbi:MAG: plastocyanin/azurin family copper-binding protein [Candidatus Limnocylindria bacterium]